MKVDESVCEILFSLLEFLVKEHSIH